MNRRQFDRVFYDHGWNDYIAGVAYDEQATLDWRDGWRDAYECAMNTPELLGKTEEAAS